MKYDFLIKGGQVFDSEKGIFSVQDLYISGGRVAAAPLGNEEIKVNTVIDAAGKYVVPGLIDEHLHLDLYGSMIGVNGDLMCIPNGITSACDGGTCGASNFRQFYNSNIVRYEASTYSYLNVQTFGNKSLCIHEEDHDPKDFRPDLIESTFAKYPEVLRGLKVRMCLGTLGNEQGIAPLVRAKEISEDLKAKGYHCPLVVHYDNLPDNVKVADLFNVLGKGDIVAHVFQVKRETIFETDGKIKNQRQNSNLVDLNRNFPTKNWKRTEKNDYYGGEFSASEIETKFIINVLDNYRIDAILSIHAPFKIVNYDGPAKNLANKISSLTGYKVQSDIGYPTPGSFGTYAGVERNIPTITLELPENETDESLWAVNKSVFSYFAYEF